VASDYSGQHHGATHEIYAFLVTTLDAVEDWLPLREAFRKQWLPDHRRLSFKQLREPVRRRAFLPFLALADQLRANLITVMVDNRVGSFIDGGPVAVMEALDDCFPPGTSPGTVEKVFRLGSLVALLQACLRDENQPSRWISDHDETLDTFEKREGFACLATYLTFGLTGWRNAAEQTFYTTQAVNLPEWVEDILAIPDFAAGAFAKLSGFLPVFMNRPTWTVRVRATTNVDWRAEAFGNWLVTSTGVLRHVLLRLAPDESGSVRASAQQFVRHAHPRFAKFFAEAGLDS
jgi:hypothetical protein